MKKIFLFLAVILLANILFAQSENYSAAFESFQTSYNQEKYNEIFNSFSPVMKEALPLEKTHQFLLELNSAFGKIENSEFVNYDKRTYANYKTKFERAVLSINISLDSQNKINGLFIKPYQEIGNNKAGENSNERSVNKAQLTNALDSYPKDISDIIFSRSKDFPNNTQLSIAVVVNNKTHYYGIIKENDSIKPTSNQNRVFEIGSITKVFTATILASLVEEHKVELAHYINNYYPFSFKDNSKITFESLANHTSGLPRLPNNLDLSNEQNPYLNYGEKELEEYLKNLMNIKDVNSNSYSYSNLGAGLLGYTLALSEKSTFQKLLQDRIFEKYGMINSFTSSNNLDHRLVKGLNSNGAIVSNWDFDALFGAGGILSTTEDLVKFAKAQFNSDNIELGLTRRATFTINSNMKIGLGWHILKLENDHELFWHNGGTAGYSSSISVDTEHKTAVIILSNVSAFNPKMKNIDNLGFDLIGTLKN